MRVLRQAIDFAEIEREYVPARKWANEIERSGHELGAVDSRLNSPASQELLLVILQAFAAESVLPEEAVLHICRWLNNGQMQDLVPQFTQQSQLE